MPQPRAPSIPQLNAEFLHGEPHAGQHIRNTEPSKTMKFTKQSANRSFGKSRTSSKHSDNKYVSSTSKRADIPKKLSWGPFSFPSAAKINKKT
jgi:hypothetical protein